jgi:signal transduction histidine kinase
MTRWRITRLSLTRAALCLLLAVVLIFVPFEDLAHARRGRGDLYRALGSIAQQIARIHDTEIEVRSTLGKGSCFRLGLPGAA